MFEKKIQAMFYEKATGPEDLAWHSEKPAKLLVEAASRRTAPAKALDLGCGAGVFSVYLANQGYDVTGLDFIGKALAIADKKADAENIDSRSAFPVSSTCAASTFRPNRCARLFAPAARRVIMRVWRRTLRSVTACPPISL